MLVLGLQRRNQRWDLRMTVSIQLTLGKFLKNGSHILGESFVGFVCYIHVHLGHDLVIAAAYYFICVVREQSGWPSGPKRCFQVAVRFSRRGFESHF